MTSEISSPPAQPMSEYEKFLFDLKGYIVIPSVLTQTEIQRVRAHLDAYAEDLDSLPEHRQRSSMPMTSANWKLSWRMSSRFSASDEGGERDAYKSH